MAGGFTNPSILFLNTWDGPERSVCKSIFRSLAREDHYTRYVEMCSGALAMPLVAQDAGYKGSQMEASDISLFSSILGVMLDDGDFERLQVAVDDERVTVPEDTRIMQAAYLMHLQLLYRMLAKPKVPYWNNMVRDLQTRAHQHQTAIAEQLETYVDRLDGLKYEPMDMFEHLEHVADDPNTVISINPPTYKAGFERFFDTKGRLTWAEPDYDVFDPDPGNDRLVDFMKDKPALLVAQQQKEPGKSSHERPFFARHLALGQYVYLHSNRPEEIMEYTGGMKVMPQKSSAGNEPMDIPLIPDNHEITEDSKVVILPVKANVAEWYRRLWVHRLVGEPGSMNCLVTIDGYAAGVIGYNLSTMQTPYNRKWENHTVLRFAFGAPHEKVRLTRLITMLALRKETIDLWANDKNSMWLEVCQGAVTVEMTRHPEIKGLRGLMKLHSREKHPDGWKLVYAADWRDQSIEEMVREFVNKEEKWLQARK